MLNATIPSWAKRERRDLGALNSAWCRLFSSVASMLGTAGQGSLEEIIPSTVSHMSQNWGGWGGKREHYLTLLTSLLYDGIQLLQPLLQCLLLWQYMAITWMWVGLMICVARIYLIVQHKCRTEKGLSCAFQPSQIRWSIIFSNDGADGAMTVGLWS